SLDLRLFTLVCMYIKFNTLFNNPLIRLLNKRKSAAMSIEKLPFIPIDYDKTFNLDLNGNLIEPDKKIKMQSHLPLNHSTRNKPLLTWRDLSLNDSSSIFQFGSAERPEDRKILRNLNGQVCFGTLTALMGMSGAGKTSLLRVLNGQ